ncbi:MAG: hypothetical protein LC769_00290 [Chloroflexi bacterium]|nr:hypothetical protein [Chloroflexota bacterium]
MLSQKLSRIVRVSAAVLATASIAVMGTPALAQGQHAHRSADISPFTASNCWVISAKLNGNQPPTTTCLQQRNSSDGNVRPDIGPVGCDPSGSSPQLQLWSDAGYSGNELCLYGSGADDLSVWGFDQTMTSWSDPNVNNAPWGKIYQGTGETGSSFSFSGGGHNSNVGSGWNDKARSVCIWLNCP